eukprot:COSAG04_NODE_3017_length_3275_cov_2.483312_1_plen_294_part_00
MAHRPKVPCSRVVWLHAATHVLLDNIVTLPGTPTLCVFRVRPGNTKQAQVKRRVAPAQPDDIKGTRAKALVQAVRVGQPLLLAPVAAQTFTAAWDSIGRAAAGNVNELLFERLLASDLNNVCCWMVATRVLQVHIGRLQVTGTQHAARVPLGSTKSWRAKAPVVRVRLANIRPTQANSPAAGVPADRYHPAALAAVAYLHVALGSGSPASPAQVALAASTNQVRATHTPPACCAMPGSIKARPDKARAQTARAGKHHQVGQAAAMTLNALRASIVLAAVGARNGKSVDLTRVR